ncbi:hypothetical protein EII22_08035 [Coriobacteriales bacterium OH1046]|nr:hypothetical protein EII22_08035 [Coriobacteriales bacterium OH1046]
MDDRAPYREQPESSVICTEHTSGNLRGYGSLLACGLLMVVSSAAGMAAGASGSQAIYGGIGLCAGAVLVLLSGYMLAVWKNRQIEVGREGIVLTDAFGKATPHAWDDVRIIDGRTAPSGGISFKMRDKREEPFAPTCGNFRAMCELLIRMGRLRRIDEAALARKRRAKSLFDVVQGGFSHEKADKSLYLPEDAPEGAEKR